MAINWTTLLTTIAANPGAANRIGRGIQQSNQTQQQIMTMLNAVTPANAAILSAEIAGLPNVSPGVAAMAASLPAVSADPVALAQLKAEIMGAAAATNPATTSGSGFLTGILAGL